MIKDPDFLSGDDGCVLFDANSVCKMCKDGYTMNTLNNTCKFCDVELGEGAIDFRYFGCDKTCHLFKEEIVEEGDKQWTDCKQCAEKGYYWDPFNETNSLGTNDTNLPGACQPYCKKTGADFYSGCAVCNHAVMLYENPNNKDVYGGRSYGC